MESLCNCGEPVLFLDPVLCGGCETPMCGRCMVLDERCIHCIKSKNVPSIEMDFTKELCDQRHLVKWTDLRICNDDEQHKFCSQCEVYPCEACGKTFCSNRKREKHVLYTCKEMWRCDTFKCLYAISKKRKELQCFCGEYQCWHCVTLYKALRYGMAVCKKHEPDLLSNHRCGICNNRYPMIKSGILRVRRVPVKNKHTVVKRMDACSICFTPIKTLVDCLVYYHMDPTLIEKILIMAVQALQIENYNI